MKVYIATDLEGISGVTVWEQTRDRASALYQEARRLLTAEANAAVQGALEGGAEDIVVLDGHGGGFNFVPEELHPAATYITGPGRSESHPGLDDGFDAAFLVGYHAMAETPNAVLAHTQSSKSGNRYWYNGRESGEIAQSAIICGHYGVPVVLVTGDEATCAEARQFLGEQVVTVSVKTGLGITCCQMVPPARARACIRQAAAEALGRVPDASPYAIDCPITARLQFPRREVADAARCPRSTRIDARTFERVIESPLDIHRF
jgi:D-amino peptidase